MADGSTVRFVPIVAVVREDVLADFARLVDMWRRLLPASEALAALAARSGWTADMLAYGQVLTDAAAALDYSGTGDVFATLPD